MVQLTFNPQVIVLFSEIITDFISHFPLHLLPYFFKFIPESPEFFLLTFHGLQLFF